MILFIKHVDIEGPETLGKFFEKKGHSLSVIALHRGDKLPMDLKGVDAVVSLGGPMNVYEDETYAFLRWETEWIRRWVAEDNDPVC